MKQTYPENFAERLRDRVRYQLLGIQNPDRPRVICVGMSKTATSSICDALQILGYRTIHYAPIARIENDAFVLDWPWWMNKYDAMADVTVAAVFRELDAKFPTSKFILTIREEEAWLNSCRKHFTPAKIAVVNREGTASSLRTLEINRHMLGANVYERETFLAHYRRHNEAVRAHFEGNPRFAEMDLSIGKGWAPLCDFLGKPVPDEPFPRSNARAVPWGAETDAEAQSGTGPV